LPKNELRFSRLSLCAIIHVPACRSPRDEATFAALEEIPKEPQAALKSRPLILVSRGFSRLRAKCMVPSLRRNLCSAQRFSAHLCRPSSCCELSWGSLQRKTLRAAVMCKGPIRALLFARNISCPAKHNANQSSERMLFVCLDCAPRAWTLTGSARGPTQLLRAQASRILALTVQKLHMAGCAWSAAGPSHQRSRGGGRGT